MKNLQKLLLEDNDLNDNDLLSFKSTEQDKGYMKIEITQDLLKYKKIDIELNHDFIHVSFLLNRNTYNVFNKIKFSNRLPLMCIIHCDKSDFKNFHKLIYNILKLNKRYENRLNISFYNNESFHTIDSLKYAFDHFHVPGFEDPSIEDIEEYLDNLNL